MSQDTPKVKLGDGREPVSCSGERRWVSKGRNCLAALITKRPVWVAQTAVMAGLGPLFGLTRMQAARSGLLLAAGGEFAFVALCAPSCTLVLADSSNELSSGHQCMCCCWLLVTGWELPARPCALLPPGSC